MHEIYGIKGEKEKMSLSDDLAIGTPGQTICEGDLHIIKEFIKKLKDKFLVHSEGTDCLICGSTSIPIALTNVNEIIDEKAGEKLI